MPVTRPTKIPGEKRFKVVVRARSEDQLAHIIALLDTELMGWPELNLNIINQIGSVSGEKG